MASARALAFFPSQVLLPCRHCTWRVGEARSARSSGYAPKSVGTWKSSSCLARRLATAGLQLAAVMMMRIRILQRCKRGRFAPTSASWRASSSYPPARATAVRKCSKCCQLFRAFRGRALFVRGMVHPYFSVGSSGQVEAFVFCLRRAGSSGISWRILFLVKKTPHCHRVGFEPRRISFKKKGAIPSKFRRSRPSMNDTTLSSYPVMACWGCWRAFWRDWHINAIAACASRCLCRTGGGRERLVTLRP